MAALEHFVRHLDILVRRFAPDKNVLRSAQKCPARRFAPQKQGCCVYLYNDVLISIGKVKKNVRYRLSSEAELDVV